MPTAAFIIVSLNTVRQVQSVGQSISAPATVRIDPQVLRLDA